MFRNVSKCTISLKWLAYVYYCHGIIEFGLEGTFKGHLFQTPAVSRDIFNQIRLFRASSSLTLNVSSDGNLYLTILIFKNFFPESGLRFSSFSLKPFLLVLLQQSY